MGFKTIVIPIRTFWFVFLIGCTLFMGSPPNAEAQTTPDPPAALTAVQKSYWGIDLKWTQPASMGSGTLSHYLVELLNPVNKKWNPVSQVYQLSATYKASDTSDLSVAAIPLYRSLHKGMTDHFYTTDKSEWNGAVSGNWGQEGIQAYVFDSPAADSTPLYRSFHHEKVDHFYTTDKAEWKSAGSAGWAREKIECYVFKTQVKDSIPLYRSFNNEKFDHFYTTDQSEWTRHAGDGWSTEGIEAYVFDHQVFGLKADTTYTFRVSTVTAKGTSPPVEVSIKTP